MSDGLIPRRYAKALFKLSEETGTSSSVYDEMKVVIESFEQNSDLAKMIANPFLPDADKSRLLLAAAGDRMEDLYKGFVRLVINKRRTPWIEQMAYCYRDIYREKYNISQVCITTAVALPEAEMKRIRGLVEKSFRNTTLEFAEKVDKDIIGGFVIDVDSVRMDASLRNEIENLRLTLLSK